MANALLEPLLILQDRDIRRLALEAQLKAVPSDIALVERDINAEKQAIESAKAELKDLETKKKGIENDIGSAEDTLGKYKTQQISVRKNDEYQALGHQIETVQTQIGDLEGRELEIMYSIDSARKRFSEAEAVLKSNIAVHEARIRTLREREANLAAELKTAQAQAAAARAPVAPALLRIYDRVAARGMPAVVPIRASKCGGCHLKVSSEIESAARGHSPDGQPPVCDQCGRLVYWEG